MKVKVIIMLQSYMITHFPGGVLFAAFLVGLVAGLCNSPGSNFGLNLDGRIDPVHRNWWSPI